ncbi:MAG: universal stress protein [Rubrobacter sp.]
MSDLPKKILLATDGSEEADLAAKTAADLAAEPGSELHVVTVGPGYPLYLLPDSTGRFPEIFEEEKRETRKVLDAQVRKIEALGGRVEKAHQRSGKPDREILDLAEELDADMVVVGSRGLGGLRRALMGSVSTSVVRHAHCPVLVVREKEDGHVDQS